MSLVCRAKLFLGVRLLLQLMGSPNHEFIFVSTVDCIRAVRVAEGPSGRGMEIQSGSGGKPLEVRRFYPNPRTDKVRTAASQSKFNCQFDFTYFICLFHMNLSTKMYLYVYCSRFNVLYVEYLNSSTDMQPAQYCWPH